MENPSGIRQPSGRDANVQIYAAILPELVSRFRNGPGGRRTIVLDARSKQGVLHEENLIEEVKGIASFDGVCSTATECQPDLARTVVSFSRPVIGASGEVTLRVRLEGRREREDPTDPTDRPSIVFWMNDFRYTVSEVAGRWVVTDRVLQNAW